MVDDKTREFALPDGVERRTYQNIQFRVIDSPEPKIQGYAALFNTLSEPICNFRERILPGAFSRAVGQDVRGLLNHDPNYVLGRTTATTLRLIEDERGLSYEIDPPDTQWAKDLLVSMRRGDINQSSFGFIVEKDSWTKEGGVDVRNVEAISDLFDVSVVTYPAYQDTRVFVRSLPPGSQESNPDKGRQQELNAAMDDLLFRSRLSRALRGR